VPGRGFAHCVRAVRKLARPATTQVCQELAARVAHLAATMKRGTGLSRSREALARAAVERREASAPAKSGARRDPARAATLGCAERSLNTPFGAPPPFLFGRLLFLAVPQTSDANKAAPRERESVACTYERRLRHVGRRHAPRELTMLRSVAAEGASRVYPEAELQSAVQFHPPQRRRPGYQKFGQEARLAGTRPVVHTGEPLGRRRAVRAGA
jgi:hypothetical protein